jgi:hypothetical protein
LPERATGTIHPMKFYAMPEIGRISTPALTLLVVRLGASYAARRTARDLGLDDPHVLVTDEVADGLVARALVGFHLVGAHLAACGALIRRFRVAAVSRSARAEVKITSRAAAHASEKFCPYRLAVEISGFMPC